MRARSSIETANIAAPTAHSERARKRESSGCAAMMRMLLATAPAASATPVSPALIESCRSNNSGMRKMLAYSPTP